MPTLDPAATHYEVLPPSVADAVVREGARFLPKFSRVLGGTSVDLSFPERGDAPFQVVERRTGLGISARLREARGVVGDSSKGYLVYAGALVTGGDVIHIPGPTGTEDWLTISGPEQRSVSYEVALGDKVAGLRLFANTFEILDAQGMPRLRVSPPYLVDAKLERHEAKLALSGCAADTDRSPPWSHAVLAPGSRTCMLTISWDPETLAYPALLDPDWSSTGNLANPGRGGHVAGRLNDGTVLVAGGTFGTPPGPLTPLATAERFTLDSGGNGVWAAAATMKGGARAFPFSVIRLNKFYVINGSADYCTSVNTTEYFNSVTNDWTETTIPSSNPPRGRSFDATATLLSDGRIIVAGGTSSPDCNIFTPQVWTDIYDTTSDTWTRGPDLPVARSSHTATPVPGGDVILVGGQSAPDSQNSGGYLASTQIFNHATNQWIAGPTLNNAHRGHATVSLNDSSFDVLVFGGLTGEVAQDASTNYGTTERWTGGASWTLVMPGMATPRQWANGNHAERLLNGSAIAVLGTRGALSLTDAEVFDPTSNTWASTGALPGGERAGSFTVTQLGASGKVLVAGGQRQSGVTVAACDLYTPPGPDAGLDGSVPDAALDGGVPEAGPGEGGGPGTADATDGRIATDGAADAVDTRTDIADSGSGQESGPPPDVAPDGTAGAAGAAGAGGAGGVGGAGGRGGSGGVAGTDAGRSDAPDGAADAAQDSSSDSSEPPPVSAEGGGCSCRLAGERMQYRSAIPLAAMAALTLLRRRRRRDGLRH
jgi:MYXO-CTERM domain-containing protein